MGEFLFEGKTIECEDGETVLNALLGAEISVDSGCRAGACQACILRSTAQVPRSAQKGLDLATIEVGGFLSCQAKVADVSEVVRLDPDFFPTFAATLVEKRWLSDDVLHLGFQTPDFGFYPGRFVQLIHQSGVKRPYSIASSALERNRLVEFHVRILPGGVMGAILEGARVGDLYRLQGPFGKCAYDPAHSDRPILMIGSGTGLAPLYSIVTDAIQQGHPLPVRLYVGAANPSGLYFTQELEALAAKHPSLEVFSCCDEQSDRPFRLGSPLDHALSDLGDLTGYVVYLCGHPQLVKAAQKRCFLAGANLKDIHADPFEYSS